jgi:Transmembrane domain of unknown function (DUF3566)
VSAEPLFEGNGTAQPPTPRPSGVVDLARYRGRTGAKPALAPPEPLPEPRVEPPPVARPAAAEGEVVIRRVRLRSVFKMTFGFSLCSVVVVIGAGVLIWLTASTIGVVDNLESLAEDLGWVDVELDGPAMLRAAAIGGGILVVAATFLSVVFAEVFNLLSTITGGLRAEIGPPPTSRRDRRRPRKAAKRGLSSV